MKTNELMLNDWVCYHTYTMDGEFEKPRSVNARIIALHKGGMLTVDAFDCDEDTEDSIEPIELTGEMLSKNGFVVPNPSLFNGRRYVFRYGGNATLTLVNWPSYYTVSFGGLDKPIRYVHELQHILRYAGLNNEADDFIIE